MKLLGRGQFFASLLVFLALCTVGALRYNNFLSYGVFLNLFRDNAFLGIVAVGMTFVILTGGIDLSVGSMIGFSSVFAAKMIEVRHWPAPVAIGVSLIVGTAFGAGMGWTISRFSLPPFLVTLAGMFLARGAAFIVSLESISVSDNLYMTVGTQKYALPALFLLVFLVGGFLLNLRPFGRNVLAIGGSEPSAVLLGVPVHRTKIAVYAISGFCSALAGIAYGFYTTSGNATAGTLLELDAIASVVIGGTFLTGGVGGLGGTMVGVLMLGLIQTGITFEGTLSSWWTKVAVGVLLLVFILPQRLLVRRATG